MKKQIRNLNKYLGLIIGLLIVAVFLPLYVYLISFKDWVFDLSDKGVIGDAIGGITAPIIGIIGAVLIYLTFRSQVKANIFLSNQNELKLLIELINELKKDVLCLYDNNSWHMEKISAPYLKNLKEGDIQSINYLFKRKLMYIFNDYIFLNERVNKLTKLETSDKATINNSLGNIYECYLDNYCTAYEKINLEKKPNAKLSIKLQELATKIININKERPSNCIEDD